MISQQRTRRGSILLWVVVFTGMMILGYFYFSLSLRATLERQNSLAIRQEGEIVLAGKLQEYTNPIPAGKTRIVEPTFFINITKFKPTVTGYLDAGYAKEYHFMKSLDEADDTGQSQIEKISTAYVCWGKENEPLSQPIAALLSWSTGNTGSNFSNTPLTFQSVPTGTTPPHVCGGYRFFAGTPLTITPSDTKDYLLYVAAPLGGSYKLAALDSSSHAVGLPDVYWDIYARWTGRNDINVEKQIQDRRVYEDGSVVNLPYNLYNLFCNEKSYSGYRSC